MAAAAVSAGLEKNKTLIYIGHQGLIKLSLLNNDTVSVQVQQKMGLSSHKYDQHVPTSLLKSHKYLLEKYKSHS